MEWKMSAPGTEKQLNLLEQLRPRLPLELPAYLAGRRWYGGKARRIHSVELLDLVPLHTGQLEAFLLLAKVEYEIGTSETYVLPLFVADSSFEPAHANDVIHVQTADRSQEFVLGDPLKDERFLRWLLDAIEVKLVSHGTHGDMRASFTDMFSKVRASGAALDPKLGGAEQSNTSIIFGDSLILKFFRRIEEGINPDLEIGTFLTEKAHFSAAPPVAGSIEYTPEEGEPSTLAILQGFVPNHGDAWRFTMNSVSAFLDEVSQFPAETSVPTAVTAENMIDYDQDLPIIASDMISPYLSRIRQLGRRTAELHLALASDSDDPAFAPEPYSSDYKQQFERSTRALTERTLGLLRQKRAELPDELRGQAEVVINAQSRIVQEFQSIGRVNTGKRIRIHGDYHLGQVLYTGVDFVIIDFEGEPARSLAERRMKRSPLQDVAGMVRSFHYAAFAQLLAPPDGSLPKKDIGKVAAWAENWYSWVTFRFLKSYFANAQSGSFLPTSRAEVSTLLRIHLLEKAVYELGYELNNRPTWVAIPLAGITRLLAQ
jgi:maltose alpha-D-glucosyltransferase/alpha-amylase